MAFRTRNTFNLALGAALAARQPAILRHLVNGHGCSLSARVMTTWPNHQIADLLSMLPRAEQLDIFLRLPLGIRTQLTQMGLPRMSSNAGGSTASTFNRFRTWLLESGASRAIAGRAPSAANAPVLHHPKSVP